jgi:hypothetical protein
VPTAELFAATMWRLTAKSFRKAVGSLLQLDSTYTPTVRQLGGAQACGRWVLDVYVLSTCRPRSLIWPPPANDLPRPVSPVARPALTLFDSRTERPGGAPIPLALPAPQRRTLCPAVPSPFPEPGTGANPPTPAAPPEPPTQTAPKPPPAHSTSPPSCERSATKHPTSGPLARRYPHAPTAEEIQPPEH